MPTKLPRTRTGFALALVLALCAAASARADLLFVGNYEGQHVGKFTSDGVGSPFGTTTGLDIPTTIAFDGAGNLYTANAAFNDNSIVRFTPGGVGSVFATTGLNRPAGSAFDGAGNLYIANQGGSYATGQYSNTIVKFTPDGAASVFASTGLNAPHGLAFDRAGNLYAANYGDDTIVKFTPSGLESVFATSALNHPVGLAFDSVGNLFVANEGEGTYLGQNNFLNSNIVKFTPAGVGSIFATTGLYGPQGLAFDSAGNLYTPNAQQHAIMKFTPGGAGSVFAGANSVPPTYLAFTDDAGVPLIRPGIPLPRPVVSRPLLAPPVDTFPVPGQVFPNLESFLSVHGPSFSPDTLIAITTPMAKLNAPGGPPSWKGYANLFGDSLSIAGVIGEIPSNATPQSKALDIQLQLVFSQIEKVHPGVSTDVAEGAIAVAKGISEGAEGGPAGAAVGGLGALDVWLWGTEIPHQLHQLAKDPPSPDYLSVVSPANVPNFAVTLTGRSGDAGVDAALSKHTSASLKTLSYLSAANASFDRYAGALQAGDAQSAGMQLAAVLQYLSLFHDASEDASADTIALRDALVAAGMSDVVYDPAAVASAQNDIAANGFSSPLTAAFSQMGLTSSEIDTLQSDVLAIDPNQSSGNLLDALTSASAAFDGASLPEPSTMAFFALVLSGACGRWRRA